MKKQKFENAEELEDAYIEAGDLSMVVVTALDDHLILGSNEDGGIFYQGMPMADDEEGTSVDPNRGWIGDLPHQAWPLALMVRADVPVQLEWMVVTTVANGPTEGRTINTDPLDEETARWLMADTDPRFTRALHRRVAAGSWESVPAEGTD